MHTYCQCLYSRYTLVEINIMNKNGLISSRKLPLCPKDLLHSVRLDRDEK